MRCCGSVNAALQPQARGSNTTGRYHFGTIVVDSSLVVVPNINTSTQYCTPKMESSGDKKREAESPSSTGINKKSKTGSPTESENSIDILLDVDVAAMVLAFAARNKKNRFFIPSKSNAFASIPYENVMIDNGCNSALLPFPTDRGSLEGFANSRFTWSISQSMGTGVIHSAVLKIKSLISFEFPVELNGKELPVRIPYLRFHLGKAAARFVRDHESYCRQLGDGCKEALDRFLTHLGEMDAPERRHVLLGQSFIGQVFSAQLGDITVFLDKTKCHLLAPRLPDLFASCTRDAQTLVRSYEGFDDLEDEDHDGDADEEDVRRSWDPDEECVDELLT